MTVNRNSPTLLRETGWKHQSCPLDFSFWCLRERRRGLFVFSREKQSVNQKNIRAKKKKTNIPDTLFGSQCLEGKREYLRKCMGRKGRIQTVQWLDINMSFFAREQDGVCASWPVARALISLVPYVSVGMQRVSSLRTQRVAGSSTECEAHKKEHDWQFQENPSPNHRPQGRRRDLRLHRCPARRGRPRSRTGQSQARTGRAERLGDARRGDNAMWFIASSVLLQYSEKTVHRGTGRHDNYRDRGGRGRVRGRWSHMDSSARGFWRRWR